MSTMNYLINHKQRTYFCLGKSLLAENIVELHNKDELLQHLKKHLSGENYSKYYYLSVYLRIIRSIGIKDIEAGWDTGDTFEDEALDDYVFIGSVYTEDDSDIGKTHGQIYHKHFPKG